MSEAPALAPFFRLLRHETIDSTNEEAKRLAAADAAEGTLVWAMTQSAGHGRRGNAWISPPGNLYFSLLLRPDQPAARGAQLGFAAALAVGEAVERFLPAAPVTFKWPNDVLLGGRKLAGILLESQAAVPGGGLTWLVIGIGVNLASAPEAVEYPATSLAAAGVAVAPEAMLPVVTERLLAWHETWRQGFAGLRAAWLARAAGLGKEIRVRLPREELRGRFTGLDDHGALVLDEGGRVIAAGDVFPAA